ncbi:RNA-directed DNA polymerase (Reverse transcriptase), partial [Trifolium medium]|nr:RNA-directed DNA polymerase (Reverse transcriptase) [Trifolium medium]
MFCSWVEEILHSARLSVLVKGKAVGFFGCVRGVRQGDPLSPLLFCIAEEVLSRTITLACDMGTLRPMSYCRGVQLPTHVLYANDVMIFCKATKSNIRCLLNIFQQYGEASGQLINKMKSKFYSGNVSASRLGSLSALLGFSRGTIPFSYLGCPIFQ